MAIERKDFGGLMFAVTYGFTRLQRNLSRRAGLYNGQPRVLTILMEQGSCTLKELSALCDIGMPSLSVSVRNMEKNDLILREGSARSRTLTLTETGRARALAFHEEIDAFYTDLLAELGEADTEQLYALLKRLEASLSRFNDAAEQAEAAGEQT